MGMTMAEKILAGASHRAKVSPNEFVTADLDVVMGHDLSFWAAYLAMTGNGFDRVWDPEKIDAYEESIGVYDPRVGHQKK